MDVTRLQRWTAAGQRLWELDPWLSFVTTNLGRLDCKIIELDRHVIAEGQSLSGGGHTYNKTESLSLSYFWILGAYELVRVLDQRAREGDAFCSKTFPKIKDVKHQFERIRIPLAKLEASRRNKATDFQTAIPLFDFIKEGSSWIVAPNVAISRRELADQLLHQLTAANQI
jgi:hypothetical protein